MVATGQRRVVSAVFLFLLMVGLSACAGRATGVTVTLREADDGMTVGLKRGDKLVVELGGVATTGFSWEAAELDKSVLKQQGEPDYKAGDSKMMGGNGTWVFAFSATGSGQTSLQMVYHQSWDKETPPAKVFQIKVLVK
jgi:predicted secreted protein